MRHLLHYTPRHPEKCHARLDRASNQQRVIFDSHIHKTTTLDRGVIQPDSQEVNAASVQKPKYPKRHIALTYRDLTSTNKTACGEYASRTLSSKQAPSMANTIAIDSKQGRRAKPEGSPPLLCAFHPCFWGENPDGR